MQSRFRLWSIEEKLRTKVTLLAVTFGFMTGTQAIWRTLKASVFSKIVGATYCPDAKIYSLFLLIPLILMYSKLVDAFRRHHMVYFFTLFHGIIGLLFSLLLLHPTMGITNTATSPHRILGWLFYFFMESFSAFLSTTFWAFANSINKPKDAKNYYGIFVAGSKIGGLTSAGLFWFTLSYCISCAGWTSVDRFSDATLLSGALAVGSLFLLAAAGAIYLLMKWVPGSVMHGYEAVYKMEKKRETGKEVPQLTLWQSIRKSFDGLIAITTYPYVFGIFMLSFFHDIIITLFDYRVLTSADAAYPTAGGMALYYAGYFFIMHSIGLLISIGGTTPILRILGNRAALLVYPFLCMGLTLVTFFYPTSGMFFIALVLLRAFNYGLNHPIREILYIPTTKEIKFKAKAWTDAFGTRIAKTSSSVLYKQIIKLPHSLGLFVSSTFMFSTTFVWLGTSYFLGRTLQRALDNKHVIGGESALPEQEQPGKSA